MAEFKQGHHPYWILDRLKQMAAILDRFKVGDYGFFGGMEGWGFSEEDSAGFLIPEDGTRVFFNTVGRKRDVGVEKDIIGF